MFKMSCSQCGEMYYIGEGCPCWKKSEVKWESNEFTTPNVTIAKNPEPVGYWLLYGQGASRVKFAMYHKPTDEQIKNTEQLLGWTWEDKHD